MRQIFPSGRRFNDSIGEERTFVGEVLNGIRKQNKALEDHGLKALIISVGTGVGPTKKAAQSLANAIAFSVKHHNPDKTFFVASIESQKTTLPQVLQDTRVKDYEVITTKNSDDIEGIYEDLQPKFKQIKQHFSQIAVDYTSGTKAMTSALTILGTIYEANTLSYITGKRKGGIVQTGTEEIRIIQPYFATAEQEIKVAIKFFNQNQFNATITILTRIENAIADSRISNRINPLKKLAKAYDLWDKFQHQKAFETLRKINEEGLDRNKRFLGQLLHSSEPEPYYIVDLVNNAYRRGTEEKKYDDAVARLYRTIELIAQYELKAKYNIHTSDVKLTDIPGDLARKWNINLDGQKIRIPLEKAYELLNAKNDPLGKKFTKDEKLKDLLNKRNRSILAHSIIPVNLKVYREIFKKTTEYAAVAVQNLTHLVNDSMFIKWTE